MNKLIYKTIIIGLTLTGFMSAGHCQNKPETVAGIPVNYDESKTGTYTLPDPLTMLNGKKVKKNNITGTLTGLKTGEKAVVQTISDKCQGIERRRLMDLGFIPGSIVEVALKSPFRDPTAYLVKGAMIALRDSQAELIHIIPA